ncbi:V-type ATP synthase subunit I [Tannockella kyphosi]|uniref:V-type ATP synthase subunit I n=1 Tax=Tannockella kyphosi TaxID=2899121 RepID=UPI002011B139|nr:V-type ATPase 116kDa subunit family protein [Tannockella kyphosi]
MAIAKLSLGNIRFEKEQLDEVLLKIQEFDEFHLEPASKFTESVAGIGVFSKENPYEELCLQLEDIQSKYNFDLKDREIDSKIHIIKEKEYVASFVKDLEALEDVKEQLEMVIEENKEAIIQLTHVSEMDINFDDLFSCKYLQIRFGKIPLNNLEKIQYYQSLPFTFTEFDRDKSHLWCMYASSPGYAPEVDNVFSSLYFERIRIPEFVHGNPLLAIAEMEEETNAARGHVTNLKKRMNDLLENNRDHLEKVYSRAKHLNDVYGMQKNIIDLDGRLSIYGFVEVKKEKQLKTILESIPKVQVVLTPATSDARLDPPTKLTSNWFVDPFKMFVEMYGVPGYNEIDPTVFVALSYTLLFGIMFGDMGQGLLLSLFGYFAYKKWNMQLGLVGVRLGISSMIFGFVYGSVFGNEEILVPIFHTMDSSNTMTLLIMAVGLGVCFILIAMLFSIYLNFKQKNYGDAYFSQNGLCGFIFYTSALFLAGTSVLGYSFMNPVTILLGLVIPIIGVFLKEPLTHKLEGKIMFPHGFGAFFMEGFFELFEVCLSFVTNTMSFLRVGGFVLSHAGMMLVVYTLAEMVGGAGYWVVLVLGNLFVMGLEGLIVGIQVLRLEFYEMFSRYYKGNGKPFVNVKEN